MVTKMELKKIILASAVASVITGSAAHADMSLQIGGNIDAQIGFRNEDSAFERVKPFDTAGDKRRGEAIVHDTTLTFEVFGHTDILGGLNYGGKIVLEADTSSSKYHMPQVTIGTLGGTNFELDATEPESVVIGDPSYELNRNAREVMVFFDGDWGHLEAGNTYGATKKMQVDAGTVAAGNGGVHGDSGLWINSPLLGNMRTPDFYTNKMAFYHVDDMFLPVLLQGSTTQAAPFSTELATAAKISYYSPNFNGLRFGVTYTPDTDVNGTVSNIATVVEQSSAHGFGFEDVFEGGFMYDGSLGDFGFQLSVLGQTGDVKKRSGSTYTSRNTSIAAASEAKYEDLGGYEIGFATEFMGVGFAASYGEHDALLSTMNDLEYYTLGLGYEMGPWAFSVNYMKSEQESKRFSDLAAGNTFDKTKKAEFENLVFDVAYQCQGMMPYLQVASFEAVRPENGQDTNIKNDGTVVLVGAKISF